MVYFGEELPIVEAYSASEFLIGLSLPVLDPRNLNNPTPL